ncbi:MAG: DNA recombination protein RmuC [Eubacteriales bacterium]|nr:DNA recombination protein RmuC [Eubacteriales bacterium]
MQGNGLTVVLLVLALVGLGLMLMEMIRMEKEISRLRKETKDAVREDMSSYGEALWRAMQESSDRQNERLESLDRSMEALSSRTDQKMEFLRSGMNQSLDGMSGKVAEEIGNFRAENSRMLAEMRGVVDEKLGAALDERLGKSFQTVSRSLDQVSRGLGEMRTLAQGVGDLKKVLSNVKTRGTLGEIRLGAILGEILAPGEYQQNVNTKGEGKEIVEYAVRLPGENGNPVWLPIDSKFPAERYQDLMDARESGDADRISRSVRLLKAEVRREAKDIRDKYIAPPKTTDFGILFLPTEGLYAEVISLGMIEPLQREFHVNIAGPTTMAALLSSLQAGFRTIAIQKRSGEVWETLGAVKTEFARFEGVLRKTQETLTKANTNLDQLIGVRTRAMQKKLQHVTEIDRRDAARIFGDAEDPESVFEETKEESGREE